MSDRLNPTYVEFVNKSSDVADIMLRRAVAAVQALYGKDGHRTYSDVVAAHIRAASAESTSEGVGMRISSGMEDLASAINGVAVRLE